jgi:hypothetical protein
LGELSAEERENILVRNWMSHDALWLNHVAQRFGMEAANELNRQVCRDIGRVDAQRLDRALGMGQIETMEQYLSFFDAAYSLYAPSAMELKIAVDRNIQRFHVTRCFAYEGITKAGMAQIYDCGIFERILGWLDTLGLRYVTEPPVGRCLMALGEECRRTITLDLEKEAGRGERTERREWDAGCR